MLQVASCTWWTVRIFFIFSFGSGAGTGRRSPRRKSKIGPKSQSWWTCRIYIFFFCSGRGKGESGAPGAGWGRFLIENFRRGGVSRRGRGRGAGRVELGIFFFAGGGGGLNIFFRGRNVHQAIKASKKSIKITRNGQFNSMEKNPPQKTTHPNKPN